MELQVLGPLRVYGRGDRIPRGSRQRALLASLLVHANEVTWIDHLSVLAWGEDQLDPGSLRCQLVNSQDTCAAFHIAATGYEREPCPALE